MKLKRICGVSMCYLGVEVRGEVDDGNGFEWASWMRMGIMQDKEIEGEDALFNAYTASDAEKLGDEGDLVRRFHLNAQLSCKTPSEIMWSY